MKKNNRLKLEYIPSQLLGPKTSSNSLSFLISNNDVSFSERIISDNIIIENLCYLIFIERLNDVDSCIKLKYISKYPTENIKKEIAYSSKNALINFEDFDESTIYKVRVSLVERMLSSHENIIKNSNEIIVNVKYGEMTEERINQLNKEKYKTKKIYSKSEKDSIININNEINFLQLESLLDNKDIKDFTFHNRNFKNIDDFKNQNAKFSRVVSEGRMKRIIYTTNLKLFFDEKMLKNNIPLRDNEFLKNKWFMGPIYSYDENYSKFD